MGTADIIPGISGGTIAFILGIYEELIQSIKSFDLQFLRLLVRGKFREAFSTVSWKFLGPVLTGILLAIFSLSQILSWLLRNKPVLINSFFFGLIIATIPIIGRIIKKWTLSEIMTVIFSGVGAYYVVGMAPVSTPESSWFLFLSGTIAISAMILPGISGAFILVLLGKYDFILEAVNQRDFMSLGIFVIGIIMGIVTFVRILGWLFDRYHDLTIAFLTGIVIGSLRKIWPWKETLDVLITSRGKTIPLKQINILPSHFSGEVIFAILLIVCGFGLALLLNSKSQHTFQDSKRDHT